MSKKTKLKGMAEDQNPPVPTQDPAPAPDDTALPPPGHNLFNPDGELVVDVFETHDTFVVLAAIAGVQIKDLDISVEKEMMVIKGDRQDPHEDPTKKFFYQECYWGP